MCSFLAPKAPPPAAIPEAPQSVAPQESDPAVQQSRMEARPAANPSQAQTTRWSLAVRVSLMLPQLVSKPQWVLSHGIG